MSIALRPGIDRPAPFDMAEWLERRAEINLDAAQHPEKYDRRTLPYVAVRLQQAADIIRELLRRRSAEQLAGEILLRYIDRMNDEHDSEMLVADLLRELAPLLLLIGCNRERKMGS